jgi:hypothetical protein
MYVHCIYLKQAQMYLILKTNVSSRQHWITGLTEGPESS